MGPLVLGDDLDATDVFAVDMAAGRVMGLSVVGFAWAPALVLPFAHSLEASVLAAPLVAFLASPRPLLGFGVPRLPAPSCLSSSTGGVSTAVSGIIVSTITLFFRALNSSAMDSLCCATIPDSSCSSTLKLSLRFDKLGSPLPSLFWTPSWRPIWPLFSTITKLVLILERGRGEVLSLPAPENFSSCLSLKL